MADLGKLIQDAVYIGVGFGVITFQRAQVQRQELTKQVEAQLADARGNLTKLSGSAEDRVKLLEERFEAAQGQLETVLGEVEQYVEKALDELAARLPEQARDAFDSARSAAREATTQLRARVAA